MSSFSRLAPVLLLVLAPALSACAGDSENITDDAAPPPSSTPSSPSASSATDESATATDTGSAGLPAACDVVTPEDVASAYGVAFGLGEVGGGGHSEGDVEWQSDNCDWEAKDLMEVQLELSVPDDYATGFTCPEPTGIGSTVTTAPAPGPQATDSWWEVDDSPPLEATLRVCTPAYNVDIAVEFEDGVDFQGDPKLQTNALAAIVLAKLG